MPPCMHAQVCQIMCAPAMPGPTCRCAPQCSHQSTLGIPALTMASPLHPVISPSDSTSRPSLGRRYHRALADGILQLLAAAAQVVVLRLWLELLEALATSLHVHRLNGSGSLADEVGGIASCSNKHTTAAAYTLTTTAQGKPAIGSNFCGR